MLEVIRGQKKIKKIVVPRNSRRESIAKLKRAKFKPKKIHTMKHKEAYQIIEKHFDSKEPLGFMQVRRLLLSVKHNISQEDYQEIYLILGNHFNSQEPLRFSEANRILDVID